MRGLDLVERLSLLLVLTGLTTMYAASLLATPPITPVSRLDAGDTGTTVRVRGTVTDHRTGDTAEFFRITGDSGEIQAVNFDAPLEISAETAYTFTGRVDIYQGELELIVEDVERQESGTPHPG
ncbi:MAG: OB-fold nucleic acid binding domain-containing protein [Candidatus Nanohaloarchaea archaeon]